MTRNNERMRIIACVFYSCFATATLILIYGGGFDKYVQSFLILVSFGICMLILSVLNGSPMQLNIVWEKLKIFFGPSDSNKEKHTESGFFGIDPKTIYGQKISKNARIIRDEIHQILRSGKSYQNISKCLELIDENYESAKDCWILLLNKVRFLAYLGRIEDAQSLLEEVIEEFWDNLKARSNYYEIKAWFEELKLDPKLLLIDQHILNKQKDFLFKGLNCFPENHAILMSLFVVFVIEGNEVDAQKQLNKAIDVNETLVFETLEQIKINSPDIIAKAQSLAPDIASVINTLEKIHIRSHGFRGFVRGIDWFLIIICSFMVAGIFAVNNLNSFTSIKIYDILKNGEIKLTIPTSQENIERGFSKPFSSRKEIIFEKFQELFENKNTKSDKQLADGTNVGKKSCFIGFNGKGSNIGKRFDSPGTNVG